MIKIKDVNIVPNITTTGKTIKISVLAEESNWNEVKDTLTDWSKIKAMRNWQELKDY